MKKGEEYVPPKKGAGHEDCPLFARVGVSRPTTEAELYEQFKHDQAKKRAEKEAKPQV